MGKYSFMEYAEKYLADVNELYADETMKTRRRRFARIERTCINLKEKKLITTTSPRYFTPEDIRAYVNHRRSEVTSDDVQQDLNLLKLLCDSLENPCVSIAISKYHIKPVNVHKDRLPCMSDLMYKKILERGVSGISWDDFHLVRAYALVLLYLNTGARNKEIRLADVRDLDTTNWIMSFVHVKGEYSYGQQRSVPVRPEIRELIKRYLVLREKWLVDNNFYSPALFPAKNNLNKGYLDSNAIRRIKDVVAKDLNIKFDLRQCRRTFGQRYMDSGVSLETTSVLMGHSSTKTTEEFYCRRKNDLAILEAVKTWSPGAESGNSTPL